MHGVIKSEPGHDIFIALIIVSTSPVSLSDTDIVSKFRFSLYQKLVGVICLGNVDPIST